MDSDTRHNCHTIEGGLGHLPAELMAHHESTFVKVGDVLELLDQWYNHERHQMIFVAMNSADYLKDKGKMRKDSMLAYRDAPHFVELISSLHTGVSHSLLHEIRQLKSLWAGKDLKNIWGISELSGYKRYSVEQTGSLWHGIHYISMTIKRAPCVELIYVGNTGNLAEDRKLGISADMIFHADTHTQESVDGMINRIYNYVQITHPVGNDDYISYPAALELINRLKKFKPENQ